MAASPVVATDGGGLSDFLEGQGFDHVKLTQEELDAAKLKTSQKHLVVSAEIGAGNPVNLMVDTGSPMCAIAGTSAAKMGLVQQKTSHRAEGSLGSSGEFLSITKLSRLRIGKCVLQNLPALIQNIPHLDGVFGCEDLRRIGAVMDCAGRDLYTAPHGPEAEVSDKLSAKLVGNGFTSVPMHLTPRRHLEVSGMINGVEAPIEIDTGALLSSFDKELATKTGVLIKSTQLTQLAAGGRSAAIAVGEVKELSVGDYKIVNAEIAFVDFKKAGGRSACYLGIGDLTSNSAIIDLGHMTLFLRP